MEEEPGSVVWVLLTLSTVAALALSSLRYVPPGHRIVATRRGIVSRVAGPGLFLRVPVADRVVLVPSRFRHKKNGALGGRRRIS